MKPEYHRIRIEESIRNIKRFLDEDPIKNQRTIGFLISSVLVDLFELYLHELNLIDPGFQIKHIDFRSKRTIERRFPFDFPYKDKLINIMSKIEKLRDKLCYGKPADRKTVEIYIKLFEEALEIFREVGILD